MKLISPAIKYIIPDVHMGASHRGLTQMIKNQKKVNSDFKRALKSGGLVLFVNGKRTAAKIYRENGPVVGYLRLHEGTIMNLEDVMPIAEEFGGSISFSAELRRAFLLLDGIDEEEGRKKYRKPPTKSDADARLEGNA